MLSAIIDYWSDMWEHSKILVVFGLILVTTAVVVLNQTAKDLRAWEEFKIEHNCRIDKDTGYTVMWVCGVDEADGKRTEKDHVPEHL